MDASVATVLRFIEAVNAHDVNALCELMTEDHRSSDEGVAAAEVWCGNRSGGFWREAVGLWKKAQQQAMALLGDGIVDQLKQAVGRLNTDARSH